MYSTILTTGDTQIIFLYISKRDDESFSFYSSVSVYMCTVQCELLTWEGLLSWTDSHHTLPHYQNPNASQVLSCSPAHTRQKLTSYTNSGVISLTRSILEKSASSSLS